ncbi:unnamed protein product [Closterium sp. NIES-54]
MMLVLCSCLHAHEGRRRGDGGSGGGSSASCALAACFALLSPPTTTIAPWCSQQRKVQWCLRIIDPSRCCPCPARHCCLRAAPAPSAPAAREQPLPCAPLLLARSPCPARHCCLRAAPASSAPAAREQLLRQRAPQPRAPARQCALQPSAPARPATKHVGAPRNPKRASAPCCPARRCCMSCCCCCCCQPRCCCYCTMLLLLLLHTLLLQRSALPSSAALPEPRYPAPTEPHCPTAAPTATATTAATTAAAARAATAGTTAVAALACALLPTHSSGLRIAAARGGQQQPLPLPDTQSPQQLREWVIQRARPGGGGFGFLRTAQRRQQKAAALGAKESTAALGASESAAALGVRTSPTTGPASAEALHTFTLDSGASRCFFRDCTTFTPLAALVPVSLANPTGDPVVTRASTVLLCPAVSSGSLLSGLIFIPGRQCVVICTCSRIGRHLATFTRRPGSSLYTLTTASAQVAESGQVAASSQVSAFGQLVASCSCRVLSHQTLLWHHRLSHPFLPRLRSMHSRLLVSCLPRSMPSLPRSPAPPCLPCVEGRQRAAPHSSEFPCFRTLPGKCFHVSSDHCSFADSPHGHKGIRQTFTLPASPRQNGIAECCIGLIMEVARTSMTHAAAPHFLWPFAVRYAAHQLNLWPHVSEPETSPTLRWTGKVGDAPVFRVWGALSLVHDAKVSKLSSRTLRCVFLGFPTNAPPWQFYHPRERRVFSSQDVTFDESVCFYRLHPHAAHPVPLAPLFLVPVPPPVDPIPPQGPAPSGVSQVDPPPLVEPLKISSDSSGPAEGGYPATDDTAATRRSPRLETPPSFPPRPSSLPLQPAAVDSGAENAGAEPGGEGSGVYETEGEGSGGAATGGADPGATAA